MTLRIGFLISHPIQYWTPILRELDKLCELTVYFAHRQTAEQQAHAGFGVPFEWDTDIMSGYRSEFLTNVSRRPSSDSFWGCNTPGIVEKIAQGRFDAFVVPGWALWSYWQAVFACRRNGVPIMVRGDSQLIDERRGPLRAIKQIVFPSILRCFDGFLYVGERNREYLLHYGVAPRRLFFSPHCVDNDAFRSGSEAARQSGGSTRQTRTARILFAGKLIPRKRPLDILRAAKLLQDRGMDLDITFAGSGQLGEELASFAHSAGLSVKWRGFVNQSEMPAMYAAADVVVLPSQSDTWGLVVNEAMACGVPAVVSDIVGCGPDLVVPGLTGEIFPLGDIAALSRAIEAVLRAAPEGQRRDIAARIAAYSPAAAARGILEGAVRLQK
ncbi:glycosyltransferase family 4 protein [Reyranella sp.]|jgi:glycosyltransferase involved in cell wall biosynthesis|uniref:glycosyltransferase family 4 protein n=1 Tax=Reyranella sp. TaxID=1929291 RepID=UPI002F931FDA